MIHARIKEFSSGVCVCVCVLGGGGGGGGPGPHLAYEKKLCRERFFLLLFL